MLASDGLSRIDSHLPHVSERPSPFLLLRLLADGKFRSGEGLCRELGCSRAELRARLQAMDALGMRVIAVRGRGIRLAEPVDLIRKDALAGLPFHVELLDECESTNTVLVERARNARDAEALHASAIVCERQNAGRGRRGAQWHSAIGASLTFSVLWRFRCGASGLSGLSLAAGVAVVRALGRFGAAGIRVKWPNDILLDRSGETAKLGGILIELAGDASGPCVAVIGIGLNLNLSPRARDAIGVPAADTAQAGIRASRSVLLAALLGELGAVLEQFSREGFAAFRDEWMHHHAYQGRRVALRLANQAIAEGEALGVAADGALEMRVAGDVRQFHSGELSLRPA